MQCWISGMSVESLLDKIPAADTAAPRLGSAARQSLESVLEGGEGRAGRAAVDSGEPSGRPGSRAGGSSRRGRGRGSRPPSRASSVDGGK